jgi:hypothetical protein
VSYDALGSFLNQNENQTKSPVALAKSPHQFVFRLVDTTAIIEPHGAVLRRQGFFAQLFGKRGQSTTLFTVGHDPPLIDLSWKDDRTLLIRYPSDSAILPNFAVNRNGKAFKLSASDMPRITTSPLAKCHPSRDGCGEGPKVVGETSRFILMSRILANKRRKLVLTPVYNSYLFSVAEAGIQSHAFGV